MNPRVLMSVLALLAGACGGAGSSAPTLPATTHEAPATTAAGRPALGGGLENPMPLGQAMTVGGWGITVTGRSTSEIGDTAGSVLLAVGIAATYVQRPGQGSFFDDAVLSALGSGGARYEPVSDGCPSALVRTGASGAGETVVGSLCFSIPADVSDVLLVVDAPDAPHRVFLATE